MKVFQILHSLISVLDSLRGPTMRDTDRDDYDPSVVLPPWEEHPRARQFRQQTERDFLRNHYPFH